MEMTHFRVKMTHFQGKMIHFRMKMNHFPENIRIDPAAEWQLPPPDPKSIPKLTEFNSENQNT